MIAAEMLERRESLADQGEDKGPFFEELTMDARRLLGLASLGLGDVRAAESMLREAAMCFSRTNTADSWRRARAEGAWGECLLALRRFDEAEPILLQAQKVLEREVGLNSTATQDVNRHLVRLNEARRQ